MKILQFQLKDFKRRYKSYPKKKKSNLKTEIYKVKDLFDIERGKSKYTKKYGDINKGDYPVYSASNYAPLTFINTFDFDGKFLTWATNGFAGYIMLIDGKFSINADRGLLKPKHENINIQYIKTVLEPKLRELAKGRKGDKGEDEFTKVYPSMIENVEIEMFIDKNGKFDIESQNEIAEKYQYIAELKAKIEDYKKQIEELNVEIENTYNTQQFKVSQLFTILGEENLTQTYINFHKGEYPVYSGQLENMGIFGYIDRYKYDENLLTWVTYGNSGYMKKVSGKFNIGRNNCGLRPNSTLIDLDYIKHIAEPIFIANVKGEKQKSLPQSIVKNIEIPIPVNSKGEFDLSAQLQISEKYCKIEQVKKSISEELDKIASIEIDYA